MGSGEELWNEGWRGLEILFLVGKFEMVVGKPK